MRTASTLLLLFLAVGVCVPLGCNTPPVQPVEMAPPPEPPAADGPRPKLTEIRPVDNTPPAEDDPAAAETPPPTLSEAVQGRAYIIQKGDTYWNIAARILGNGRRWKEIEAMNSGVDRAKLKVGQSIRIPAQ